MAISLVIMAGSYILTEKSWKILERREEAEGRAGESSNGSAGKDGSPETAEEMSAALSNRSKSSLASVQKKENSEDSLISKSTNKNDITIRSINIIAIIILVIYIIMLVLMQPGFFVYDAGDELKMVESGIYTTHHPLLHVLFLGKTITWGKSVFGSYNAGIIAYLLIQIALLAIVCREALILLKKLEIRNRLITATGVFFAACPTMIMFALCSSKDALFTAALLMTILCLTEMAVKKKVIFAGWNDGRSDGQGICSNNISDDVTSSNSHSNEMSQKDIKDQTKEQSSEIKLICKVVLSAALMMLLRHNGMYAWIVFAVLFALTILLKTIYYKKHNANSNQFTPHLTRAIVFILPLVIYLAVTSGLTAAVHATGGEHQEILSVPIQQLARVYKYETDEFRPDQKDLMLRLMTDENWRSYEPKLSDNVKMTFNNAVYEQNKAQFFQMWFDVGIRNPIAYAKAWLLTSYENWYPFAIIDCYTGHSVYDFTYGESSYFEFNAQPPAEAKPVIPALYELFRQFSLETWPQRTPFFHFFFSPASLFWFFIFTMMYSWYRRRYRLLLVGLLPLLVWMTVLLGPCTLVRYVLILWFAWPLFLAMLLDGSKFSHS